MLQEIVEGAVSLDAELDVIPIASRDGADVLLVATDREENDTLGRGGEVIALSRQRDHVNLYVLRLFDRVRGSAQFASAIRRVAQRVLGGTS